MAPAQPQEMRRHVTNSQINSALSRRLRAAENAINREVKIPITQTQFDALVSFTYNVGIRGAASTLNQVNNHKYSDAAKIMNRYVYVHPYKNGKRMPAVRSRGLAKRRREESAPFLEK
jgi:lysozyme